MKTPVRKHRLPDVPHGIALYGCVPRGNPVVVGFGIGSVEGGMPQHHQAHGASQRCRHATRRKEAPTPYTAGKPNLCRKQERIHGYKQKAGEGQYVGGEELRALTRIGFIKKLQYIGIPMTIERHEQEHVA